MRSRGDHSSAPIGSANALDRRAETPGAFKSARVVGASGITAEELPAMLLKDKVALITGAGSGIGRASAIRFAEEGAKVMVADVRAESASNSAAEIEKAGGVAKSIAVDVRVAAQVERMVNETIRAFGRLDILFN